MKGFNSENFTKKMTDALKESAIKEEYSEKFGGDYEDFIKAMETIKAKLMEIDTTSFGAHLAEQMVDDWVSECNYQIEKAKRLASGDEFYQS